MPDSPRVVTPLERILQLKRLPHLAALPVAELTALADIAQERFFPSGRLLLRAGEPVRALHTVVEGEVKVEREGVLLGRLGPGTSVGGVGLLAGDPEEVDVTTTTDTLTLELEADAVLELFEDRFPILLHVLRDLCGQLIHLLATRHLDPARNIEPPPPPPTVARDLDLVERIIFMRQMLPFRKSSINALFELSRTATQVRFQPGVTLWKEGDPSPGMYLIMSGHVAASSSGAGGLRFRPGPGYPLGSLEAVSELPRWYDAVTETKVVALQGNAEALIDVFEDNFEMAMDYLAMVARGILRIRRGEGVVSSSEYS